MTRKDAYIIVDLRTYQCAVVVTWEPNIDTIIKHVIKKGVEISKEWKGRFTNCSQDADGVCMTLGDKNTDILVWLKNKPLKARSFGTLYHELYHAVDHIAASHNLETEREARAYIFEHLINACNQVLWA